MIPIVILERRVRGVKAPELSRFVTAACRSLSLPGGVSVLVTSSRRMQVLNSRFRGKESATDVLSFPGPQFTESFAGDIAISIDIASHNARSMGHSIGDEVRILVLHGLLHLAGYDHEADNGEMARRETRLRKKFRLPLGLLERSSTRKIKAGKAR